MKKFQYLWENLKGSFWFVPTLILFVSLIASIGFISLDSYINFSPSGILNYLFSGSPQSARSILSIIAGAMIGVAGTVFSITLVALTLASNQFGSRLLRNFMYDRINQIVLGTYVSTFVYCLVVLNSVMDNEQNQFVPVFAVFVAILLALINMILLIYFIHHISMSIQSDKVISDISNSMTRTIRKLFPDKYEESSEHMEFDLDELREQYKHTLQIESTQNGYIESIDYNHLLAIAKKQDLTINISYRAGDFVVKGIHIIEIYSNNKADDDITQKINNAIIIGNVRTPLQDAEFAIHQMVEIAIRALSPGINDPYTAIACIDNLSSVLCYLAKAKFPSKYRHDDDKTLRLIIHNFTYSSMLDAAFNQIRQFSGGSPSVVIRLMEALITIDQLLKLKKNKKAIRKHAEMVYNLAKQSFPESHDLKDLEGRYRNLIE